MDKTASEYGPVASTSAVRLDSPSQQHAAHPNLALDDHAASCASRHAARDAAVDLPAVLARVRSAYLAAPASSPLDIIRQARASFSDDESARQPPTPPPPIVLDPQPHSSRQGLLTPFLLQALFLGASALGLFARRKVRPRNEVAEQSAARRNAQCERQEAEDRVDELQALDLLVAAFAVPEASESCSSQSVERGHAREERCWPLAQLLRKIEATQAPVSRQTVASVLHFVGPAAPHPAIATATDASAPSRYSLARPVLGLWAWNAFSRLPSNPASDPPDDAFLTAFLHLLYPSGRRVEQRHLFSAELDSTTDRNVLNAISTRLFPPSPSSPVSLGLLRAFARASIRARRLDHLEAVSRACRGRESGLRLLVAARGLELISKDAHRRQHAQVVVRWAHHLVQAVRAMQELGKEDIAVAGGAISRLVSDFSIDRSLDPFIASALRALLRHEQAAAAVLGTPLVERVLRHLLHNPAHPSSQLALAVFDAIPPQLVTLAHYDTLLSSPFAPLVQAVWQSLVAHKTLRPSAASVTLYLRPLAGRSAPPNALELTYSALQQLNHAGLSKTREMWHLVLRIAARRATDPAWLRLRHRMKREGFAPDHETAAIVVSRELVRRDVQLKRRVTLDTRTGERVETVVQAPRWRSGRTMVRRVREDARVWSERMRTLQQREGGEALREQVDVLPNLLVQGVAQATREYDLATVVKIVHARLGVDLGPLVDTPAEANVDLRTQLEKVKVEMPPPSMLKHREFARLRAPAYRISMSGLERRGRHDLAQVLERLMRDEEALLTGPATQGQIDAFLAAHVPSDGKSRPRSFLCQAHKDSPKPADLDSDSDFSTFLFAAEKLENELLEACGLIATTCSSRTRQGTAPVHSYGHQKSQKYLREIEHERFKLQMCGLAKQHGVLSGAWMAFLNEVEVDDAWQRVVEETVCKDGRLAAAGVTWARVSSTRQGGKGPWFLHVYVDNSFDSAVVETVFKVLVEQCGFAPSAFKSIANITSKHASKIAPSTYSKTSFMTTPEIKAAIGRYREHGPAPSLSPLSGAPPAPAVDVSTSYHTQPGGNTSHDLEQPHASTSKPSPGARKETKVKRPIQAVGRGGGSKSPASSRGRKRKSRARSASSSDDDDEAKDSDDEEVMGFDPIGAPGSRVPRKAAQKARRAWVESGAVKTSASAREQSRVVEAVALGEEGADGEVKEAEQDGKGVKRIKVE
ncbi:hypothetical protein Rhopal_003117-T1 [Rhodotorula paludigena]|uniref:Proteophosphoglycan ppg4 n=1 Tax=Rhodotorula paludigena TaxID=86838 RepID=A0AAV5GIV6_9BASI|nr:hypothetical protein Rhopal_003117-T1 [Rhodotorula paludigena]